MNWYCIRTKSGQEKVVVEDLRRLRQLDGGRIDVLLPQTSDGKVLFPGYIFASFELNLWRLINNRPGVVGILPPCSEPIPVDLDRWNSGDGVCGMTRRD